nr:hypothetical protein [uncultured Treponema sp.]
MKHILKIKFSLVAVFLSFFLCSCNFLNLTRNTSSLAVKLPQPQVTRSIPYDGENILFEDGKLPRDRIDFYEITITSADGETIPKSVPVGTDTIVFEEIAVGNWTVEFKAYAVDSADKSKKIIVAKNRNPIKVEVKSGETANVDVIAYIVKYYTGDSDFSSEISMNVANPGYQLKLPDSYTLPISELIKFEVYPGDGGIVEVTKDGFIIPKKSGTTTIAYSRLQDGSLFGEIEVTVFPVVKINCFVNGVNVSGKYPFTKITEDDGDILSERLSYFSVESIMSKEGLENCDWYFDADFAEKISEKDGLLNLYEKHSAVFDDNAPSTYGINIYADTRRRIGSISELKTAFDDDESGDLLITELFRIDSNLSLNLKKDMNIYGTSQDKGFDGYDFYCLKITGDNIHSLKFDTLKFINCHAGEYEKGGAIYAENIKGITVNNCKFTGDRVYPSKDNNGGDGGSIYFKKCSGISVINCNFYQDNNTTASSCSGGFIYVDGDCSNVNIENSQFECGYASHGGAIALRCNANIKKCSFMRNVANWRGGAVNVGNNAVVYITDSTFINNSINNSGKASDIYANSSIIYVSNCVDDSNNKLTSTTCMSEDSGSVEFND